MTTCADWSGLDEWMELCFKGKGSRKWQALTLKSEANMEVLKKEEERDSSNSGHLRRCPKQNQSH